MRTKILVNHSKFIELSSCISCQLITERQMVSKSVFVKNKEYVVTGSISSGETGYRLFWGNEICNIQDYKGDITPLSYNEHNSQIDLDRRERGYKGLILKYGSRTIVMGEPCDFVNSNEGIQATLF